MNAPDATIPETGARATGWRLKWRRFALWFNPTLIQNALWPVIAILAGFQLVSDANTSWQKWFGEIACFALAIVLAGFVIRRNAIPWQVRSIDGPIAANIRLIALASIAVDRWPGGTWTSPALQWLFITLIFGFTS